MSTLRTDLKVGQTLQIESGESVILVTLEQKSGQIARLVIENAEAFRKFQSAGSPQSEMSSVNMIENAFVIG